MRPFLVKSDLGTLIVWAADLESVLRHYTPFDNWPISVVSHIDPADYPHVHNWITSAR